MDPLGPALLHDVDERDGATTGRGPASDEIEKMLGPGRTIEGKKKATVGQCHILMPRVWRISTTLRPVMAQARP